MKRRPKCLFCYKKNNIQQWYMTDDDNDTEFLMSLLEDKTVDKHSIFAFPASCLTIGLIWIWQKTHHSHSNSIWNFFEEYEIEQPSYEVSEEVKQFAEEDRAEKKFQSTAKYGFISPDGRYFHCEYQGHHSLAYDICFGQFETNNPERYLEEHGWIKIYSPSTSKYRYAVHTGDGCKITKEQLDKLIELGLDESQNISYFL